MQNKIANARLNKIVFARNDKKVIARLKRRINIQIEMATLQERLADSFAINNLAVVLMLSKEAGHPPRQATKIRSSIDNLDNRPVPYFLFLRCFVSCF